MVMCAPDVRFEDLAFGSALDVVGSRDSVTISERQCGSAGGLRTTDALIAIRCK